MGWAGGCVWLDDGMAVKRYWKASYLYKSQARDSTPLSIAIILVAWLHTGWAPCLRTSHTLSEL